ncbi:MAG: FHA domain-containing protein [Chloroflexota bacterium]
MTLAIVLLVMRVLSALLLFGMVGLLFLVLWRDYQSATVEIEASRRVYGQLVELQELDDGYLPTGEKFPLMSITSIGRAPINTIHLDDQFASSEHCAVFQKNGVWWLEDRNSRNGTNLNGVAVTEPVIVTSEDIITIGTRHFRLEIEGY